jgi:hypothetical protein
MSRFALSQLGALLPNQPDRRISYVVGEQHGCDGFRAHETRVRQKSNFVRHFKLIWVVQSPLQKYSYFGKSEIMVLLASSCLDNEGRFAIVTNVGCGMRWTLWRRKTSAADADGEVVWS